MIRAGLIRICACFCVILLVFYGVTGCKKSEDPKDTIKSSITGSVKTSSKASSTSKTASSATISTKTESTSSEESEGDDDYVDSGNTNNGGDVSEPGEEQDIEEEIFDLGGRVVVIAHQAAVLTPIVKGAGNAQHDMTLDSKDDVEAKYNCQIEWIRDTLDNVKNGIVSAGMSGLKYCDLFRMPVYEVMPTFINQNLIIPLDEYLRDKNYEEAYSLIEFNANYLFWGGKQWGVGDKLILTGGLGLFFNRVLLDNEGLAYPYEAYWNGTWNWDMMLDYSIKLTKDFNGDGVTDQWAFMNTPSYNILYSNGGNIVAFDENGNPYYGFDSVPNIRALNFLVDMVSVYKVVDRSSGLDFSRGNHAFWAIGPNSGLGLKGKDFHDFGFVAFPKGPDVDRYICPTESATIYCIPSILQEDEIEKIFKVFLDWTSVEEHEPYYLSVKDQQEVRLEAVLPNYEGFEVNWEIWYDLLDKQEMVYTNYFSPLKTRINAVVMNPTVQMKSTVVSAIDAFRNEAMSIINSYYQ